MSSLLLSVALLTLSAWTPRFVPAPVAEAGSHFGKAVATADVNGDGFADVIVGEPGYRGTRDEEGRVLVYLGSPSGPASAPSWTRLGLQAQAHFGAVLSSAGDMNGDGYEDVVMGIPDFDGPRVVHSAGPGTAASVFRRTDSGAIAFFLGSPSGLSSSPILFRTGIELGEHFGISAAAAGDIDGDGFADVIVGATGTGANQGAAFLFAGSASGPRPFPVWIVLGSAPDTRFGFAVGGGGDIEGDGFDDVLVGAPDGGPSGFGAAFAYAGSSTGLGTSPSWSREETSGNGGSDFGAALTIAGDMNGDGFGDLVVGNPLARFLGSHSFIDRAGVMLLYRGSAAGPVFAFAFGPEDVVEQAFEFGSAICPKSDVNGDGLTECFAGGPGEMGVVRPARWLPVAGIFVANFPREGSQVSSGFGAALAAGDIDGDGFDDLVVGEPLYDASMTDQGRVQALRGNEDFLTQFNTTIWELLAP